MVDRYEGLDYNRKCSRIIAASRHEGPNQKLQRECVEEDHIRPKRAFILSASSHVLPTWKRGANLPPGS